MENFGEYGESDNNDNNVDYNSSDTIIDNSVIDSDDTIIDDSDHGASPQYITIYPDISTIVSTMQ